MPLARVRTTARFATLTLALALAQCGPGAAVTNDASTPVETGPGDAGTVETGPGDTGPGDTGAGETSTTPGPSTLDACGANPAQPSPNVNVCTVTYLGGAGDDGAAAVALGADGAVIVGANLPGENLGLSPTVLGGGGDGAVLRLAPTGTAVRAITRVGSEVRHLALDERDGAIVVVGAPFGLAVLEPDASALRWQRAVEAPTRVAVGSDGTIAVLRRGGLSLFAPDGAPVRAIELTVRALNDVAVYGPERLVIVTGFEQVTPTLQWPVLRAYRADGALAWEAYRYTTPDGLTSDTRGLRVSIGRDQKLYYAGRSDGGVTAHARDPLNFSASARLTRTDRYSESSNWNGAAPLAFLARLDPRTGAIENGTFIAPRLSNGKGNGAVIEAITADEAGTVLVAGGSACCIENTPPRTINGTASLEGYAGGGFFAVLTPDLRTRLHWNALQNTTARAAALRGGAFALLFDQARSSMSNAFAPVRTIDALQSAPRGGATELLLTVARTFR